MTVNIAENIGPGFNDKLLAIPAETKAGRYI